jgi:CO/xanthine dehydrogenase FAD-binding subunit
MNWKAYYKPKTVAEALSLLDRADGKARIIAGGTDLVLQLRMGEPTADFLVDMTEIDELKDIREQDGWMHIGAAVTHHAIGKNALIRKEAAALAEGCAKVGSPQIRNVATLMGNVIAARPAGDGAIPLLALEAQIKIVSKTGETWMPIEETYRGVGRSAIDSTREVATELKFKAMGEKRRTKFFRMSRRKALALPTLNGAVAILMDSPSKRIQKVRIALGPAAERPFRPQMAEAYLESKEIVPESIREAARIASEQARPRTSHLRGTNFYRKEMIRLYLTRALQELLIKPHGDGK